MLYANELKFICETLRKCHIRASVVSFDDSISKVLYNGAPPMFDAAALDGVSVGEWLGECEGRTMYKATDSFKRRYIYFELPMLEARTLLLVGPYVHAAPSAKQLLELGETNGVSPKNQKIFESYYANIPVLPENSHIFIMLDVFCERVFGTALYPVVDIERESRAPYSPINEAQNGEGLDGVLLNMKLMEQRYEFENELMEAVSLGQENKASSLLVGFSERVFEKRVADPLRNMKNYCIIMNTLLRKAAENGGVHPIYLDKVSSSFAERLEQIAAVSQIGPFMSEMFRSYCRLVRKHSMRDYSPVVQNAVVIIDSELSTNLTLSTLAKAQKVSAGYLSSIFKKETGKTVTEYIRERRIRLAAQLLKTTQLQIQTVALHCGIMDVQYFSKIFKKHTGMTPKEYRESARQTVSQTQTT